MKSMEAAAPEGDHLLAALREHYGFESFRPQQRETVEHVMSGGDALVLMPTGGGKSLCYQLPAILSGGLTVVVSPLIALMQDQVMALQRMGAGAQYLNSTQSPMEAAQVEQLVKAGDVRLLYVAPERINTDRFRSLLEQRPPDLIAIDEAHCISEWGHEFRPDYRELRLLTERHIDVPTVACTATATVRVQRDIIQQLDRPQMRTYVTSFMRDNLTLRVVPKRQAVDQLVAKLQGLTDGAAIVYAATRKSTEETASRLQDAGIRAEYYHAGMGGEHRHQVQERFLNGETSVVCATIAFGMGIDKPDVRLVVHLDMPKSLESYYQEIGRAGRDGAPSECLMFYTKGVWHQQMFFIRQMEDEQEREQQIARLRLMMNFSEQSKCRWSRILRYFGEEPAAGACGHCDNCLGEAAVLEAPREVDASSPPDAPGGPMSSGSEPEALSGVEERIFEALRAWRLEQSRQTGVSAFVIASNRDLDAVSRSKPGTLSELRAVRGFGEKKVGRYGEAVLQLVASVLESESGGDGDRNGSEEAVQASMLETGAPPEDWQQRFNALSEWRTLTAEQEQCDASELLSYDAMQQLAKEPPASLEALASVDGVGELASQRYAEELGLIAGIDEGSAPTEVASDVPAGKQPSWQVSLELYRQGHTVLAIAERRMLSPGSVAGHLVSALRRGYEVELESELPSEERVKAVREELRRDPDATVTELLEHLEHKLSRSEMTLVVAHLRPPVVE